MIEKMGGATRISLLMLMATLCFSFIYSDIKDFHFDSVLALFKDIMLLVAGSFFTKSATDSSKNTITSTVSKDIPVEKKEEIHDSEFTAGKI